MRTSPLSPPTPPAEREDAADAVSKRATSRADRPASAIVILSLPRPFLLSTAQRRIFDFCYIFPSSSFHVVAGLVQLRCVGRFLLMQVGKEAWLLGHSSVCCDCENKSRLMKEGVECKRIAKERSPKPPAMIRSELRGACTKREDLMASSVQKRRIV